VFAGLDGEVDVVEDGLIPEGDVNVSHTEESLGAGAGF
jgi:hypothetical protein